MDIKEEYRLIRRAKRNDQDAWSALLEQHRHFIDGIVLGTTARGLTRDDLYQEARAAFVRAVRGFDLKRGLRLSTYAYRIIIQLVHRAALQNGLIWLPETPVPEPSIRAMNEWHSLQMRLKQAPSGEPATFGDLLPAESEDIADIVDAKMVAERLRRTIATLPERERIIVKRWMHGENYKEIADDIGISRSRAQQIAQRAFGRLKGYLTRKRNPLKVA